MAIPVFEIDGLPADRPEVPPQSPLVESMFTIERYVRDSFHNIKNPESAHGNFDAKKILDELSGKTKQEISQLTGREAKQAKAFFLHYACAIEIAVQINFRRIELLRAGNIPDPKKYGAGNWRDVLIRWWFLVNLSKIIRSEFLPSLEKIIQPPRMRAVL